MRINELLMELIQQRLQLGAKKYGDTIKLEDKRDFNQEALEELLDGIIYLACQLIKIIYKDKIK